MKPWAALALGMLIALAAAAEDPAPSRVVIGYSSRIVGRTNRTDLTAAMKAWMQTVTRERNLTVETRAEVFDSFDEILQATRKGLLDVVSVPMDDYLLLEKRVPMAGLFATQVRHKVTDQYVVLVRQDRGFKGLADLRGGSLIVLDQARALLAPVWLDTELLRRRMPVGARFFGKVTLAAKPSLAILPLFFKQTDAVLMTRSGFDTACELNPQMARQLTVLMGSPELISGVGAYRADATSASVSLYRREALRLGESAGGKLLLNLFQADAIVEVKEADLRETRLLLAEHARLLGGAPNKEARP